MTIPYTLQTIIDDVAEEVKKREPKKRKVNKNVKPFYGYKQDFLFDLTQRELTTQEFLEMERQRFYDEI